MFSIFPLSFLRRLATLLVIGLAVLSAMHPFASSARPIVIAHRGASGERPEHTLAAYTLAIAQGADFIEPDLVATKDGVLICRHENELSQTTDVEAHPEFAARRTTKTVDGQILLGFFTEDFTLAEIKTLRATQNRAFDDVRPAVAAAFNGRFAVPTFAEAVRLAREQRDARGRPVGLYPETKHPSHFRALGLPLEEPLLATLAAHGYAGAEAPVFIQSFEVGNLRRLRDELKTPFALIQLLGGPGEHSADGHAYDELATPSGLRSVAAYARGVGPEKSRLIPRDANGNLLAPSRFVADAHAAGLLVHLYTFRRENRFLPAAHRRGPDPATPGDAEGELARFFALGVDGVFTDFPALAVGVIASDRREALTPPHTALTNPAKAAR